MARARLKPCIGNHCKELTNHPSSRCPTHRTEYEQRRGSSTARGYDQAHRKLRGEWVPIVARGTVNCARCGKRITPPEPWDLGHDDHDRSRYRGPEHAACNRGRRAEFSDF